jgi:hypothetical protein
MLDVALDVTSKKVPLFFKIFLSILEPYGQNKLHVVAEAQK